MNSNALRNQTRTVLLFTSEYGDQIVGGLGRHVNDLVKAGSNHNVSFIIMTISNNDVESYTVEENVHIYRLLPWKKRSNDLFDYIRNINFRFTQFILQELHLSYDLIHIHDWMFASSSCQIKKEVNKPLITTFHSTENERKQYDNGANLYQVTAYENQLLDYSDRIIVCSQYMKDIIVKKGMGRKGHIELIPNGVIAENFTGTFDHKVAIERFPFIESPYLLAMGRLVKEKGFQLFLESFAMIRKEFPDYKVVIAGEGPFELELKQLVKTFQMESYVFFTGFVKEEERNTLLNACHLFVIPSLYEPFGIVALEAMISRKPTISFNIGGLKEILAQGRGILVDQVDSISLADQLRNCLLHPERMNHIANEGYKAVIREYQWKNLIEKVMNIYLS